MTMQLPLIGKVRQPAPWAIGLLAAGLLGTGGITYAVMQRNAAAPDLASMTVPVESQTLRVRITASGTVQPIQSVNLSPKTSGVLSELLVEQGDRVQQGQIVARMESRSVQAQLTQAEARVDRARARLAAQQAGNRPQEVAQAEARVRQAEAVVNATQARLQLAQDRVQRNQQLAAEGAISQDSLDEVVSNAANIQATLEQNQASVQEARRNLDLVQSGNRSEDIAAAQADLREAEGNLQAIRVQYEDTLIRAPFSGIITQKFATEGAFVTPTTSASEATSATSTAIVALAEGLEVLAEVPEVDVRQLQIGQQVEIQADAFPDQTFQGRVRLIAPEAVVRQNVTSFQVRIELTSGLDKLRSGMNVDTTFLGDSVDSAIVVPTVAIVTRNGESGVLIPGDRDQPQFRSVVLGTTVGDQTQILEGIQPGERVFTDIPPDSEWNKPQQQ